MPAAASSATQPRLQQACDGADELLVWCEDAPLAQWRHPFADHQGSTVAVADL